MPHSAAEALRIYSRRSKVAALALSGVTNQLDIAARLGLGDGGQSTVSRDLKAIREEWRASALVDFDQAKGKELARLDRLEAEFWSAWERSKAESQKTRTRRRSGDLSRSEEAEVSKQQRDGDPRFLQGVLDCVARRCAILGLDAPKRVAHGGDGDAPPVGVVFYVPSNGRDAHPNPPPAGAAGNLPLDPG